MIYQDRFAWGQRRKKTGVFETTVEFSIWRTTSGMMSDGLGDYGVMMTEIMLASDLHEDVRFGSQGCLWFYETPIFMVNTIDDDGSYYPGLIEGLNEIEAVAIEVATKVTLND